MSSPKSSIAFYAISLVVGVGAGILATLAYTGGIGSPSDPVVAKLNGTAIRASEAFKESRKRVFDMENELFKIKEQAINHYIEGQLLQREAESKNKTVQELITEQVGATAPDVDDKEIDLFLESKGLSLEDPRIKKEDVRAYLKFKKKHELEQGFVGKLKEKANFKLLIEAPKAEKLNVEVSGYPTWGSSRAPVTIVEFSDYECPFCSRAIPILEQIKKEYGPDKVRIVFRDLPIPTHKRALPSALAAHCADEQGKFWEFHNKLFENQQELEDDDLATYAKELGLDEASFASCFKSQKYQNKIESSIADAQALGIEATPSFIVNGFLIEGAKNIDVFKEQIDKAL